MSSIDSRQNIQFKYEKMYSRMDQVKLQKPALKIYLIKVNKSKISVQKSL